MQSHSTRNRRSLRNITNTISKTIYPSPFRPLPSRQPGSPAVRPPVPRSTAKHWRPMPHPPASRAWRCAALSPRISRLSSRILRCRPPRRRALPPPPGQLPPRSWRRLATDSIDSGAAAAPARRRASRFEIRVSRSWILGQALSAFEVQNVFPGAVNWALRESNYNT